ncbi:GNAT family N-acetyltransferase [Magnetospirillum sp. UT-4]|uniref:GNAT family N-acetyltransferase n=1 Tax=Magnetospirillum sp. UT-4 TaxID=2681467 RepID=UPI001384BAAB|nr:GNAT family N-acetyltransferase [Magnetospirillum sp. UT-4]CAA7614682.1 Gp28 [Magnetospirillum sp. UT-4]
MNSIDTAPKAGAIQVRLARSQDDIAAMIALGRLLHAESRFHTLPLDDARMAEIGRRGLEGGNPGLLIAEHDGQAVGMAIVVLGEYYFSATRTATVQLLYVAPKARGGPAAVKLLRALRRWAATNHAHDLHVNVTTGIDAARTDRFLRKMGFRQTGGNYVLEGVG